jgi:hypothetical protein
MSVQNSLGLYNINLFNTRFQFWIIITLCLFLNLLKINNKIK